MCLSAGHFKIKFISMIKAIVKSKTFYILLILAVGGGFFTYRYYKQKNQPPQYETVKVASGDLTQTVDATGKVTSHIDLGLRFETVGTISQINVREGSKVSAGFVLASLRLQELNASVAQAEANLNLKLAGATTEDKKFYEAAVQAAKVAWDQAKVDGDSAVKTAQSAVDSAKNNLKLTAGGENSQIVNVAYDNAVALLQAMVPKIDDALTQADNILGLDNPAANESFRSYLASNDPSKVNNSNLFYIGAKSEKERDRPLLLALSTRSKHEDTEAAFIYTENLLSKMNQLLTGVSDVLKATTPQGALTPASLDAKKTVIEVTRGVLATLYTNLITQKQSILDAKNSVSTFTIAVDKAEHDLQSAQAAAINSMKSKEVAYSQAVANYLGKINPPRDVDVAGLRAAVAQAVAARSKAILISPIDGLVTKVNKKVGEAASSADVVVQLLSPHYEVKVDIPETEISKMKLNDSVVMTLDALGQEAKLKGTILTIDPGSTDVQDVVYYRVTVGIRPTDQAIKPGMTANVSVKTANRSNVLSIPQRALHTKDDSSKFVRVLSNNQVTDVPVVLGLKANEGKIEVVSGLQVGQEVIIGNK